MRRFRIIKKISKNQNGISRRFEALGTVNEIEIFGGAEKTLLDRAVKRVFEIDDRMSVFKTDSDISRLNRSAGKGPERLSPETISLLCLAKAFCILSGGAFDITVRPLVDLWGIGKKSGSIPSQNEINRAAALVNENDLIVDPKKSKACLQNLKQAVDLGGIAKGYAADEVKRILTEGNVESALINLGGNIVAVGAGPDRKPWRIGIQNPAAATGKYLGVLTVSDKTVVTSGSNEKFFIKNGVRYHHILNPRTGRPAQSGLLSVTAVCDRSAEADALTTALFVLGMEKGVKLLNKVHADAIFVTEDRKVFATKGLQNDFSMASTKTS